MFPRLLQATLNATVAVPGAKLWSIPRPYLYVLVSEVISASGAVLDQVNTTVGFRSLNYTGDKGFFMVRACPPYRSFCFFPTPPLQTPDNGCVFGSNYPQTPCITTKFVHPPPRRTTTTSKSVASAYGNFDICFAVSVPFRCFSTVSLRSFRALGGNPTPCSVKHLVAAARLSDAMDCGL